MREYIDGENYDKYIQEVVYGVVDNPEKKNTDNKEEKSEEIE